jgi:6-phosphofructokinase 1
MRLGVLTGGGDCPGLNAVIRAVVIAGHVRYGYETLGYLDGWRGVLDDRARLLDPVESDGLLALGGTVLGTSRTNPFAEERGAERVIANLAERGVDVVVAIGGDDTLGVANRLGAMGVRVVGVPKTIDNDLSGTEVTFGFQTAVQTATEAIDRLGTTAESHHRIIVCEVMGRNAGWIATAAGIAGGAAEILVPEVPAHAIEAEAAAGARSDAPTDPFGHARLGGIGAWLAGELERRTGYEARSTTLGHIQRGGSPTAFDRVLATRFGVAAIEAVHDGDFGIMVALQAAAIVRIPLSDAVGKPKTVDRELLDGVAAPFLG